MQPRVRFTRTSDDVRVAYWVHGAGPVLVQTPLVPFSHVEMEWQNPYLRRWYEFLGEFATVVRYDGRTTGWSSRDVADVSLGRAGTPPLRCPQPGSSGSRAVT